MPRVPATTKSLLLNLQYICSHWASAVSALLSLVFFLVVLIVDASQDSLYIGFNDIRFVGIERDSKFGPYSPALLPQNNKAGSFDLEPELAYGIEKTSHLFGVMSANLVQSGEIELLMKSLDLVRKNLECVLN